MCSGSSRTASSAAWSRGGRVLTRPLRISGEPVSSETSRTSMPASRSAAAVPPVDTISTPSRARPRAKSTIPVLSETEMSALLTLTASSGRAAASAPVAGVAGSAIACGLRFLHVHDPPITSIDLGSPGGDQADRLGKQLMLDLVNLPLQLRAVASVWHVDRPLHDDRAGGDPLVDEVHGDSGHRHPVFECLPDRVQPRERRKERGMHV